VPTAKAVEKPSEKPGSGDAVISEEVLASR
jgi:hypothetical protein